MSHQTTTNKPMPGKNHAPPPKAPSWTRKALVGATVGVCGTVAGLTIIPTLGVKAALTKFAFLKISGGAIGAGANVAMSSSETEKPKKSIAFKKIAKTGAGALIGAGTAGIAGMTTSALAPIILPAIAVGGVVGSVAASVLDSVGNSMSK